MKRIIMILLVVVLFSCNKDNDGINYPSAPYSLGAFNINKTGFMLAWNIEEAEANNIQMYNIYQNGRHKFVAPGPPSGNIVSIQGLEEGSTSVWTISAVNYMGAEGPRSNVLAVELSK